MKKQAREKTEGHVPRPETCPGCGSDAALYEFKTTISKEGWASVAEFFMWLCANCHDDLISGESFSMEF